MATDTATISSTTGPAMSLPTWVSALAFAVVCGLWSPHAFSQPTGPGADFDVNAIVVPGCLINGVPAGTSLGRIAILDFGSAPASSAATRTASTLATQAFSMRCTPNTQLTITLNGGRNPGPSSRRLRLGNSSYMVDYSLCRDASCAPPIALSDTSTRNLSASDAADVRLVYYARLTLPTNLPPGLYTDDITVTLSW